MPTASYLRNNDYSIQDFKPFELPYSATLQELATKNAYWQQGAQRIKASFDAVLGLDPQFSQHKDYLKKFTEQANKQLTKAGKSDLAQDDNVGSAIAIFKPLYDTSNPFNENLLTDAQTNEFYKAQSKLSNAARTTDKGKTWNKNNEFYMQSGYQKYLKDAQSGDATKVKENWSQKKGYIPYYDYGDDVKQAIKNCHESSSKVTGADNNGYLKTVSNKGISASSMEGCMDFMPPQAKQQIGIDSFAQYYNNKSGLLNDYQQLVYNGAKEQRDAIGAKLAAVSVKGNKEDIAQLKESYKIADDRFKQGETLFNKMLDGKTGQQFLDDNYENIASTVGLQHFTQKAGKVFSWNEAQNTLSPDASWIAKKKMQLDVMQQNAEFAHAEKMQASKFGYDVKLKEMDAAAKAKEEGTDGIRSDSNKENLVINPNGNDTQNSEGLLQQSIQETAGLLSQESEGLTNLIGEYINTHSNNKEATTLYNNLNNKKLSASQVINFIDAYQKSKGVKDDKIDMAILNIRKINQQLQGKQQVYALAASKVKDVDVSRYSATNTINTQIPDETGKMIYLTEQEMYRVATGQNIRGVTSNSKIGFGDSPIKTLQYKDKTGKITTWSDYNYGSNSTLFSGIVSNPKIVGIFGNAKQVREDRDKLFVDHYNEQAGVFTIDGNEKHLKAVNAEAIKRIGGNTLLNDYEVHTTRRNNDGTVYVQVSKKGKGDEADKLLDDKELKELIKTKPNLSIEKLGEKGSDGISYIKVPDVLDPMKGYLSGESMVGIKRFTDVWMDKLNTGKSSSNPEFSDSDYNYFETQTPSGRAVRVSVTKLGGRPMFTIEVDKDGKYIKLPTSATSQAEVLTAINDINF